MEVILVPASTPDRNGVQRWYVEIKGVPGRPLVHLVVSNALTLAQAERAKEQVEDALHEYRRPPRKRRRKPKTVWQRLKDV